MDCVILLQFGGSVNEQFELVGMRPHVLTFENPSSFNELVARVRDYLNHKDVSQIGSALCDSVIVDDEGNLRVQEEVIKRVRCLRHSTP
jgi:hypothetical protein